MLCRFHHRQVHEGRVGIQILDDGALRFAGTDGKRFDAAVPTQGDEHALVCQRQRNGIQIDARTAVTRWCGEPMDYGMAVGGLLAQQNSERGVSAETSGLM